jgi:nucleoside-diphosphate-sugar epimerase
MESLNEAFEGRNFDVVVSTYGRLRYIAEAIKNHTDRLISVGGQAVYKGWMRVPDPEAVVNTEESPFPVKEEQEFLELPGVDHFVDRMLESEQLVMRAHQEGHYNATHFRYPIVYGPRHIAPGEWSIIRRILDGRRQLVLPGGGQILLSRACGKNVAHALLLAIDNPGASAGQIYNIRDERLLTMRQWVEIIAGAMNHEFEFVEVPLSMARLGPSYIPVPLLFQHHQVMDIAKIQQQLGYRDIVPAEQGLELVVRWLVENRPEPGGDAEKNTGDPFDYAAEDKLISQFSRLWEKLEQMPVSKHGWRHPYAHPKTRGDLK